MMKTIQELYNEIVVSKELKEQFIEAVKAGKQEAFLKEHGCEATLEEVAAFLKAKAEEDAPLSFDELENSAGGTCNGQTAGEAVTSVLTFGAGCVAWFVVSLGGGLAGTLHPLQMNDNDGRICTKN
jgi:hypothetical protein